MKKVGFPSLGPIYRKIFKKQAICMLIQLSCANCSHFFITKTCFAAGELAIPCYQKNREFNFGIREFSQANRDRIRKSRQLRFPSNQGLRVVHPSIAEYAACSPSAPMAQISG